jgi:SAM-dependent methyltransferase
MRRAAWSAIWSRLMRRSDGPREADMQPSAPWFTEEGGYFGPAWIFQYQPMLAREKTLEQVDFIERVLELERSARVLDVPCGFGRHAVELARRGYHVVGVDINSHFLRMAEEEAKRAGTSLTLRNEDMREATFVAEFDAVLNMFTSLGYFDDEADDVRIANRLAGALKSGGRLMIDFINRDHLVRTFRPRWERELPDGTMLISEPEYDVVQGTCVTRRRILSKEGKNSQTLTSLRYRMYTPTELINLGKGAGLRFRHAYGDFEGGDLTMNSERTVLVFDKP